MLSIKITPVELRAILDLRERGKVLNNTGPRWRGGVYAKAANSYLRDGCLVELSRRFLNAATVFGQSYSRRFFEFHIVMFANCETKDYLNNTGLKCTDQFCELKSESRRTLGSSLLSAMRDHR